MRIAVIGTGIAGLGAAYLLSRSHDVEVFEQDGRVGGHTNTVPYTEPGGRHLALDTGFIVHNRENYPNLVRLFGELGVATQDSEMSFSVACERCGLEYSGARPWMQGGNLTSPTFLPLLREIVRFMRTAPRAAAERDDETLRAFADREGYSAAFRDHFLVPLTASIWSTSPAQTGDFPARYAIRFFENHGMLRFRRFRWRSVAGGSDVYVRAILDRLPGRVHAGRGVRGVRRDADGVVLRTDGHEPARFDAVVVATHPDQALALLDDPTGDERRLLGAFAYTENETILHSHDGLLPRRRSARAAWNYRIMDCRSPAPTLTMTYDLNRLQRLQTDRHYLVTLNRGIEIPEEHVIERLSYAHPRYTTESLRAQGKLHGIAGAGRTWYCGAWQGYGFHEDGFASAVRVARGLGVRW